MALDRPPVSGVTPDAAIDCTRPLPSMTRSTSRLDASTARMGPSIENGFDVLKKSVPFSTCCCGRDVRVVRQSAPLEAEQIRAGRGDDRFPRSQPRGNGGQRRVAAPHDVVEERARLSEEQHLVAERDRVAIAFERHRCGRRRVDQSRNRTRLRGRTRVPLRSGRPPFPALPTRSEWAARRRAPIAPAPLLSSSSA